MNDVEDKKIIGSRIKSIRQEKGMTLEEFGKLFGAGKGLVSRWENGLSTPNPERLKSIAKIGDMTVSQLLHGERGGSHYNWEAIEELFKKIFNGASIDKTALQRTQAVVDKAFFLNFGIEDIVNIYLFQKNASKPLESLEDLQDYLEQTAEGLSTYLEGATGTELIDLEMQIAFLKSYASKIKKYLETGEWASDIISNLKEKSRRIRKDD
ncbi:helix-turn-helix transcriptional regulator [Streptococcus cristatus]|uniref:Helix-turn-helix transcriptional regulator n=1 Tax=Streptococcus cristatus TaxID=45634 RepID=A0A5B0DEZ4_STRCR|nr:helix-turn-helix transcriptional regulator [Streptococcus cristatus]KAA0964431.1 helix-turn-helix transcriptional regulator [Streptococcus cristatus]